VEAGLVLFRCTAALSVGGAARSGCKSLEKIVRRRRRSCEGSVRTFSLKPCCCLPFARAFLSAFAPDCEGRCALCVSIDET
jgi:hypothetical protein